MNDINKEIEDEQAEEARKQSQAFMATSVTKGEMRLRKLPAGVMAILVTAGNRFVIGFSPAETTELGLRDPKNKKGIPNENIIKYTRDLWQWVTCSEATEDDLIDWFDDGDAFRKAVARRAMSEELTHDNLVDLFVCVWTILEEINKSRIETKAAKQKGPKKKASIRHTSPATRRR